MHFWCYATPSFQRHSRLLCIVVDMYYLFCIIFVHGLPTSSGNVVYRFLSEWWATLKRSPSTMLDCKPPEVWPILKIPCWECKWGGKLSVYCRAQVHKTWLLSNLSKIVTQRGRTNFCHDKNKNEIRLWRTQEIIKWYLLLPITTSNTEENKNIIYIKLFLLLTVMRFFCRFVTSWTGGVGREK